MSKENGLRTRGAAVLLAALTGAAAAAGVAATAVGEHSPSVPSAAPLAGSHGHSDTALAAAISRVQGANDSARPLINPFSN